MMRCFAETDFTGLSGTTIFIDIDGTLVPDGSVIVAHEESFAVMMLAACNKIVIFSNSGNHARSEAIAARFGAQVMPYGFRKPFVTMKDAQAHFFGPFAVVGDKIMTDGIFAWIIGARYIRVRPILSRTDSVATCLVYAIDGLIARCFGYA